MKRTDKLWTMIGFVLLGITIGCKSEKAHNSTNKIYGAREYVVTLEDARTCIVTSIDSFIPTLDKGNTHDIENAFNFLQQSSNSCAENVLTLSPYLSDSNLVSKAKKLFLFYLELIDQDYAQLVKEFETSQNDMIHSFSDYLEKINRRKEQEKILIDAYMNEKMIFEKNYY